MLELVFRVFQCVWHIGKHPFWAVTTKNTTPQQKNNSSTLTQKRTHPRCNFCKIWSYTFSRTISIQNSNPEEKICDELCIYNCQLKKKDFKTYNIWCFLDSVRTSPSKNCIACPMYIYVQKHQKHNFFTSCLSMSSYSSIHVERLWRCSPINLLKQVNIHLVCLFIHVQLLQL